MPLSRTPRYVFPISRQRTVVEALAFAFAFLWYSYPDLLFEQLIDVQTLFGLNPRMVNLGLRILATIVCGLLAFTSWRAALSALWSEKWILALLALTVFSAGWAGDVMASVRHGAAIVLTTALGTLFAVRFRRNEQIVVLAVVGGALIVLSVIAMFAVPDAALEFISLHPGAWGGIQGDKNGLGLLMVVYGTAIGVLAFALPPSRWQALARAGFGAAVLLLLLSDSRGALLAGIAAAIVFVFWAARGRSDAAQRLSIGAAVLTTMLVVGVFGKPSAHLSRLLWDAEPDEGEAAAPLDHMATLSGRTVVWAQLVDKFAQKPVLGYGYNQFWTGPDYPPSGDITFGKGKPWPGSAHNGYLEFLLDFGIVGAIIFAGQLGTTVWRAVHHALRDEEALALWPILLITGLAFANLFVSAWMENTYVWIIYVSVALGLVVPRLPAPESVDHA